MRIDGGEKMRYVLFVLFLLALTACDTELGHVESHDHDGDGVEDHAPEEHDEEHDEEYPEDFEIVPNDGSQI